MPFMVVRQDITKMNVDAIVNAANPELAMGGGVCGAIFRAAGPEKMQKACNSLAPIQTGEAVITRGFALPARYVIHTAGPVYHHGNAEESERLLRAAYTNSLYLALRKRCKSIAFPLISSGIYGYPKGEALKVATAAIRDFLHGNEMDVYLAIFDRMAYLVSQDLMGEVASYIDENYVAAHQVSRRSFREDVPDAAAFFPTCAAPRMAAKSLDDLVGHLDEPFNRTLLRLIDAKGVKDVDVYKKANITKQVFSKIKNGKGYLPSKRTILALAIALELSLEETDKLLECAGYALSHSQKFDVIVEYFLVSGKYDIFEINDVLYAYDQPVFGVQE